MAEETGFRGEQDRLLNQHLEEERPPRCCGPPGADESHPCPRVEKLVHDSEEKREWGEEPEMVVRRPVLGEGIHRC